MKTGIGSGACVLLLAGALGLSICAPHAASAGAAPAGERVIILAQQQEHTGAADEAKSELAPDVEFALWIAQTRGHMLIGNDLVKQGEWKAAYPHFQHPIEELYGALKPHLADYQVPPFEDALKALANAVKARKMADYDVASKTVADALAKADAGLKAKETDWDTFMLHAAIETLKTSIEEYAGAIDKGRIDKPVEYQDGRGYIWQSERMIESVAPALEKKNSDALKQVRAGYAELKKIFPTAVPPRKPVKDHAAMVKEVERIVAAAGPLM
jgi:iron uptake system EfeUOB component EfeO/EfeM